MRIDEFSNASDIDGVLSSTEQTRFMLFGFDIGLSEPTIIEALYNWVAKDKIFSYAAESKKFAYSALDKIFNFTAKTGP